MPRLRYWIAMYLVMTAAVPSGIYLGGDYCSRMKRQ